MARRHWTWQFDKPPDDVWAVVADTARFNEAAGFPKHQIHEQSDDAGFVRYFAETKVGPLRVTWEEIPVEWAAGRYLHHLRLFDNGPLVSLSARLDLAPADGGTRVDYVLEAEPRGIVGRLFLIPFLRGTGRVTERLMGEVKEYLAGDRIEPFQPPPADPDQAARARLAVMTREIADTGNGHGLADRLAAYLIAAPEQDLDHLRPLRLARLWRVEPRPVIELCLQSVRSGLLNMDWVLLCPRCRGAKASAPSLDRLPTNAHCASCNIDYGREFYSNVELTFRPAAWLRPIDGGEFCLYGPMSTPHVVLQQTLEAGETRDVPIDLRPGGYRLRTLHPGGQSEITWDAGGFPEVVADGDTTSAGDPAPAGAVRLRNTGSRPMTIVVEERAWVRDALTAHRVTAMQAFRDLFAEETLRPGDEASIERIVLMFTDLKGSTALYERVGDGPAYNLVRAHFAFLTDTVRVHDGAIVKTIGDAVMAAFADPADAVRAAVAIQDGVAAFNAAHMADGTKSVVIKLGLHQGSTVAVRLNDRLDYFGATVNMAARLEGMSRGGDVVISAELAADPAVAALLGPLGAREESAALKGIDAPVSFFRLQPGDGGSATNTVPR